MACGPVGETVAPVRWADDTQAQQGRLIFTFRRIWPSCAHKHSSREQPINEMYVSYRWSCEVIVVKWKFSFLVRVSCDMTRSSGLWSNHKQRLTVNITRRDHIALSVFTCQVFEDKHEPFLLHVRIIFLIFIERSSFKEFINFLPRSL